MNTTIGTSQAAHTSTSNVNTSTQTMFWGKWVSEPLITTSIDANTWDYNFATLSSNLNMNFPVNGNNQSVRVCCYVWRPSTGAKVANICDTTTAATVDESSAASTEKNHVTTFSGSAVTAQSQDVIVFEAWFICTPTASVSGGPTRSLYFDGTTENNTENTTVSNHASYIQTPQDLTFGSPPASTDMTNAFTQILVNKFLTRV